jgi:UDP-3-O-[3-hydroxymyristoyl] glucosamine N-acyltransferase
MKFSELLGKLEIDLISADLNAGDPEILNIATLKDARSGDLGFLENNRFFAQVKDTHASALLIGEDKQVHAILQEQGIPYAVVAQPRLFFAKAIAIFHPEIIASPGIHPSAVIAPDVQLGENVYIAPHVVIESGCVIGDRVRIHANVTIYAEVTIGDRTLLHANCVIHPRSVLGKDCVIHSGAVIGSEGFGFVPNSDKSWQKMSQVGRAVLGDRVEVGCNSAIDRGSLGDTCIGDGVKIDNLVQIGHGCIVGEHSLLCGQVGLAGGAELGKNVILGGQVGVSNHIKIGDRAVAGAQTGIAQDVEADRQVIGHPAISAKTFLKASTIFKKLPEIYRQLQKLTKNNEERV